MFEVLRNASFRRLWLGQAISQLGDAFFYVTFLFMVKKITGDARMVGFVGAVETLPFLLLSPYGGVLADRFDRRKIMLLSDTLSGLILTVFCLLVLVLGTAMPVWMLFVVAFMTATVRTFFLPAKNAAIPALVEPDQIIRANALSYMTQSWMPMLGLAFSAGVLGILYAISAKWFFASAIAINAASFLISAWYIRLLPPVLPDRNDVHESHPFADFKEGLRYIGRRGALKMLMLLSILMSLMISPFMVAYVDANDQWFGGLPQTLTWCEFSFFAGLIIGGLLVGRYNIRRPGIGYIWALSITGLSIAMMAYCNNIWLFCGMNIVAGLAIPFADIPISSFVQTTVEDAFRGRVNSVLTMMRMGSAPLGMALGGLMIQTIGLSASFSLMGFGMVFVALLGLTNAPFRSSRMPEPVAQGSPHAILDPVGQ